MKIGGCTWIILLFHTNPVHTGLGECLAFLTVFFTLKKLDEIVTFCIRRQCKSSFEFTFDCKLKQSWVQLLYDLRNSYFGESWMILSFTCLEDLMATAFALHNLRTNELSLYLNVLSIMVQNISCKSLFLNSPYIANCISPLQIELVLYLFVHLNVGIEMIGKFTINLAVSRLIPFVFFFCIFAGFKRT